MKKEIVLYMNDGVEIGRYEKLLDAYNALQDNKRLDKEEKILGNEYYFQYEVESEDRISICEMKVYRRNNKIYGKWVG